jgi:hypothetical protein
MRRKGIAENLVQREIEDFEERQRALAHREPSSV